MIGEYTEVKKKKYNQLIRDKNRYRQALEEISRTSEILCTVGACKRIAEKALEKRCA